MDQSCSLNDMRKAIFAYLQSILNHSKQNKGRIVENSIVQASSSLLRLLCALKGIAGFKYVLVLSSRTCIITVTSQS